MTGISSKSGKQTTLAAQATRVLGSVWRANVRFARRKPLGAFGATVALLLILVALTANVISTDEPSHTDIPNKYTSPSVDALFGTDQLGRDIYSRVVHGSRVSLRVGVLSVLFGITAGAFIGIASAYFGGKTDLFLQRIVDGFMAFPAIVLALAIVTAFGSSINNVIFALAIIFAPSAARTIRAQALSIKEMDYIMAARAVGGGDWRIILRHMAPNVAATYIVLCTIFLGEAIVIEASLSFLGVGVPPDVPSWGGMLSGAARNVGLAWWLGVFPGLAIAIVVLAFNLLGDSLRDLFDPRLRGTGN